MVINLNFPKQLRDDLGNKKSFLLFIYNALRFKFLIPIYEYLINIEIEKSKVCGSCI